MQILYMYVCTYKSTGKKQSLPIIILYKNNFFLFITSDMQIVTKSLFINLKGFNYLLHFDINAENVKNIETRHRLSTSTR